jgi:hypothetical protein
MIYEDTELYLSLVVFHLKRGPVLVPFKTLLDVTQQLTLRDISLKLSSLTRKLVDAEVAGKHKILLTTRR